jgi:DNA-binding MarR family transcriptional regulator
MRFEQPPPEPLANALGFLLSWNGQRIAAKFAAALAPLGLRPPHFGVLTLLDAAPGKTQQELVERSMIDASTMVKIVDELEERGLAERRVDPDDRRRRGVQLTPEGRKALQRARKAAVATAEDVFGVLTEEERTTLQTLLRKLALGAGEAGTN